MLRCSPGQQARYVCLAGWLCWQEKGGGELGRNTLEKSPWSPFSAVPSSPTVPRLQLRPHPHRPGKFATGCSPLSNQGPCPLSSVVSYSLQSHESQHVRPPCPSPTPEVHSTHVHRVGDAIQPSHPLSSPSPPAPNSSQHQGLFQ